MNTAAFCAGIITSMLAGLGNGGGGLLVIYLSLFAGVEQLKAQGINLIFFLFSSGASLIIHIKKRKIPFALFIIVASAGVLGALAGSALAARIRPELIRRLFGILLAFSGFMTLFRKNSGSRGGQT